MKERPILFSAPMVRAILQGKKTQTRRIVKPQPESFVTKFSVNEHGIGISADEAQNHVWKCPYGVAGDRLWVRETWGLFDSQPSDGPERAHVFYRATDGHRHELRFQLWRPSIHMPRWASRITLEVVAVRVERLQDITDKDVFCEGIQQAVDEGLQGDGSARGAFRELWSSINGADSWAANPWVWVVEFRSLHGGAS